MRIDKLHIILLVCVLTLLGYIVIRSTQQNNNSTVITNDSLAKWKLPNLRDVNIATDSGKMIIHGNNILTFTSRYVGPLAKNPELRYAGNNLSCSNCHFNGGRERKTLNLVGVTKRYPKYIERLKDTLNIVQRVNGCFMRSLNGRPLPEDSYEMKSILAYLNFISEYIPDHKMVEYQGIEKIPPFNGTLDTAIGKVMYSIKCMSCHGSDGVGAPNNLVENPEGMYYIVPPIAGKDSFNKGAGMSILEEAATFIYHEMPYNNRGSLTVEEAYQIANYVVSLPRPDYNLSKK
ncbi:MAG TPA: cytochrome C oxidase Cbb3 [Bacteroidetes bacterium]|nr:cytochrome C oxidase Cbb3 [Bacteroidota bacterium]HCN36448.1 cytochrome C oxidase Cbb3 [Bacteroidota bacterium]